MHSELVVVSFCLGIVQPFCITNRGITKMEDNTTCEKAQNTVPEENQALGEKSNTDSNEIDNNIPNVLTRAMITAPPNECQDGYRRNSEGECVPVFD